MVKTSVSLFNHSVRLQGPSGFQKRVNPSPVLTVAFGGATGTGNRSGRGRDTRAPVSDSAAAHEAVRLLPAAAARALRGADNFTRLAELVNGSLSL